MSRGTIVPLASTTHTIPHRLRTNIVDEFLLKSGAYPRKYHRLHLRGLSATPHKPCTPPPLHERHCQSCPAAVLIQGGAWAMHIH